MRSLPPPSGLRGGGGNRASDVTARLRTHRINTPATAAPGADTSRDPGRRALPASLSPGPRHAVSAPGPTQPDATRPDARTLRHPRIRQHPAGSLTPPDPPPLKVPCALGRPSWRRPLSPRSLCRTPSSRWTLPGPRRLCRLSLVSCSGTGCRGRRKPLGPRHPRSPAHLPPGQGRAGVGPPPQVRDAPIAPCLADAQRRRPPARRPAPRRDPFSHPGARVTGKCRAGTNAPRAVSPLSEGGRSHQNRTGRRVGASC